MLAKLTNSKVERHRSSHTGFPFGQKIYVLCIKIGISFGSLIAIFCPKGKPVCDEQCLSTFEFVNFANMPRGAGRGRGRGKVQRKKFLPPQGSGASKRTPPSHFDAANGDNMYTPELIVAEQKAKVSARAIAAKATTERWSRSGKLSGMGTLTSTTLGSRWCTFAATSR